MQRLKVGIIGIGNMGTAHLENICSGSVENMTVTAVCDINGERLDYVKKTYPDISLFNDYNALLSSKELEAVIIAVPHPLHAQIGIAAFKADKHVLVEKPEDITVSAAQRLNAAAKNSGKRFGIMFNQRTNGLFKKARELVKSGELGELKRSVWIITNWYRTDSYYASGSWRATWKGEGGGVLLNQAPHNLDIWQWICGMPSSVTAFCNVGKFHSIEVEDEATIYTEYENGATGVFITSTGDCPGTNRLEITGTGGKLVLENGILKLWHLKTDERTICKAAENGFVIPEAEYSEYICEAESGHIGILRNFADCVLNGGELISEGIEGINELTVSNAAYMSEWLGNKKIRLPFDTELFDSLLEKKICSSSAKNNISPHGNDKSRAARWQVNW